MSLATQSEYGDATGAASIGASASPGDYFALLKPRVMSLVVLTALAGLMVAPAPINPVIAIASILAIAVGAGAAGALNMWWDADIDAVMSRTRVRPVPAGRVKPREAMAFGMVLSLIAVVTLALAANLVAAGLLASTIFFYAVIYTMWLKRSTPQNIVIGGAAGALPPVVGYAAVTGAVTLDSLALFAVIFIWTPPHFWALALVKSGEYARAGVPMMPNVKGLRHTRLEILIYTLILAPLGVAPWMLGIGGGAYALVAILGGVGMTALAIRVWRITEGREANKAAMQLFGFSILYMFALFGVLVIERTVPLIARMFA
jgi:protoheme IX farnesyltransferase